MRSSRILSKLLIQSYRVFYISTHLILQRLTQPPVCVCGGVLVPLGASEKISKIKNTFKGASWLLCCYYLSKSHLSKSHFSENFFIHKQLEPGTHEPTPTKVLNVMCLLGIHGSWYGMHISPCLLYIHYVKNIRG